MFTRIYAVPVTFLGVLALFALLTSPGSGQQKGKGKGQFDPRQRFQEMAKGRSYITVADLRPDAQERFSRFLQEQGIRDGRITLDTYLRFFEQARQARGGKGKQGPASPGSAPAGDSRKRSDRAPSASDRPAEVSYVDLMKMAEEEFKRRDRNGDNVLNEQEMAADPVLVRELSRWDRDSNGAIDRKEFVDYFIEHYQQNQRERARAEIAGPERRVIEDNLDIRPVVYRYGRLPKELPDWFAELDINKDGLISLGEWRKADRSPEDFLAVDRNHDGLLTPEEVLRFLSGDDSLSPTNGQIARGNGNNRGNGSRGTNGNGSNAASADQAKQRGTGQSNSDQ